MFQFLAGTVYKQHQGGGGIEHEENPTDNSSPHITLITQCENSSSKYPVYVLPNHTPKDSKQLFSKINQRDPAREDLQSMHQSLFQ